MKFWTVQKKDVLKEVNENGIYQPDFNKSDYLQILPNLKDLYSMVLEAFNKINGTDLPGIIYAFSKTDNESIFQIEDFDEFYTYIQSKRAAIKDLWKQLSKSDSIIMELNYDNSFNPIFIDINDFQFLMPPIIFLPPYTEHDVNRICKDICKGKITQSVFPSYIIQAHLPYIKPENIIKVYPMFELD